MDFPHLFSPLQLGSLELPNRIVHVPTDISSSHADGEVSERDIAHHGDIARGGTGFIIVGATTPDMKTGRPTVTCLVADGDNYIPGLARLAESMHRYGAQVRRPAPAPRTPVRHPALQHAGRHRPRPQAALVGRPRDHLRERRREGQGDPRGFDRRDPGAGRPVQRGRLAGEAGRLRRGRAARRPRLPAVRVHEPVPQHAHRPVRRQPGEPHALPPGRRGLHPEEVRQELPAPGPLLLRRVVRGRPDDRGGPRDRPPARARRLRRDRPLAWACRRAPAPASTRCPTRRAGRPTPPRRSRRSSASRSSPATRCATRSTASRSWPRARRTWWASPGSCWPTRTGRSRPATARSSPSGAASPASAAAGRNR